MNFIKIVCGTGYIMLAETVFGFTHKKDDTYNDQPATYVYLATDDIKRLLEFAKNNVTEVVFELGDLKLTLKDDPEGTDVSLENKYSCVDGKVITKKGFKEYLIKEFDR